MHKASRPAGYLLSALSLVPALLVTGWLIVAVPLVVVGQFRPATVAPLAAIACVVLVPLGLALLRHPAAHIRTPWWPVILTVLIGVGFAVFAKPKITEDSDIDSDMLEHIELRRREGALGQVVVASGDGRAFRAPLEALVRGGIGVTVIGFREYAAFAQDSDVIDFCDLEDIDGVFREPLPRMTLDSLPDKGAWLPPFRSLRSLLEKR